MQDSHSLISRMIRASKLEVSLYEEVEADATANSQALISVIIVGLATSIGAGIAGIATRGIMGFFWGLIAGLAASLVGWLVWSYLTYILGTTVLKGPNTSATWGELIRTIGFAHSPGVFRILSFVPFVGGIISFGASIWFLIAGVIGVRQALDISTGRAIAVCIVGWLIYMAILFSIYFLLWGVRGFF
jgi:hypothetical protein